jgi:hypothetical protein
MNESRLAAVVDALLAATPECPEGAAEPSDVLDQVEAIIAVRTPLLEELGTLIGRTALPRPLLPILQELDRRTSAWVRAAERARAEVGEQLAALHSAPDADPASFR